jgi:pyroglutamyl-peptidase
MYKASLFSAHLRADGPVRPEAARIAVSDRHLTPPWTSGSRRARCTGTQGLVAVDAITGQGLQASARRLVRGGTALPGRERLTVLVTGFGPFPGAPFNPTGPIVTALLRRRRPALANVRLLGHVFRTSYAAVDAELPGLIARHRPQVLLMFGLAARTPYIRVETRARNRRSLLFADVAGQLPAMATIRPGARATLPGRAPFARLLTAARAARVPVRLSCDAGRYLCNYSYRQAIELEPAVPRVVFVHVPKVRRGPIARRPGTRPAATVTDLARAGEAILLGLIAGGLCRR